MTMGRMVIIVGLVVCGNYRNLYYDITEVQAVFHTGEGRGGERANL